MKRSAGGSAAILKMKCSALGVSKWLSGVEGVAACNDMAE